MSDLPRFLFSPDLFEDAEDEVEMIPCENCEKDIPENEVVMTTDDVPLCKECVEALADFPDDGDPYAEDDE